MQPKWRFSKHWYCTEVFVTFLHAIKTTVNRDIDDLWSCLVCSGRAEVAPDRVYEEGHGLILLDEVQCQGTETTLLACTHSEWGQHDCSHSEDVGVYCERGGDANEIPGLLPPISKYTPMTTVKKEICLCYLWSGNVKTSIWKPSGMNHYHQQHNNHMFSWNVCLQALWCV